MPAQEKRELILIVDDSEMNRAILSDMLEDEYDILEAEDGLRAVSLLQSRADDISLILLDLNMPTLDGFGVLEAMEQHHWIEDIPVIIISAETGADQIERAYGLGASDFITRPFDALIVHKRVVNTLLLYAKQKKLLELVAAQVYESEDQNNMMINILSHVVEFRNGESGAHIRHVHLISEVLLRYLNRKGIGYHFSPKEISTIGTASALHDVGKIATPDAILNKPGKLTPEEFEIMKAHTTAGAEMLNSLPLYRDKPLVKTAYEICRWHHERWDGKGYPDGLKGDEIPITAQIVALADVYDALVSPRVYKPPLSHEEAVQMILNGECGSFSPLLMECLRDEAKEIRLIYTESDDGSDNRQELLYITQELLHGQGMAISSRTLRMVEQERMRNDFFASLSEDIQFEFSLFPPVLTLSPSSAARLGVPEVIEDPFHSDLIKTILGMDGLHALSDQLRSTSPGKPGATFDLIIHLPSGDRWHRITARANWSNSEPPRYCGAVGKAVDIHDDRIHMAKLEQMASSDRLTNLLNHASARQKIKTRLSERPNSRFALVLFDLDFFKAANDSRGHLFGDRLLVHLAEKLRASVRGGDIVSRMGGDEFLIFLEYKDQGDPDTAIDRIFQYLCGDFEGFRISISMGVAQTDVVGTDYEDLFRAADNALYTIKHSGDKGRYIFYDPSMKSALSSITPIDYDTRKEEHK